ncbi:hypothetical protein MKJ04_17435 [Pontibacter sp. E15-1]|uniref:hypothetical protein n=1 Tax=Pontibacter sp. E15-1 TaxID=2919918 RepID=UPI001F503177|nr:hypothetical protein [Pontibacter sp. E15-1]MCJ8166632.1 hypothetical protein [Pontibacter sp. E15-1]
MKNRLFSLLFALLCLTAFVGCDKKDSDSVSPNVSLLTKGQWTGSAIYIEGEDKTAEIKEQASFDFTKYATSFDREGNYEDFYEGDSVMKGTWEYANDERVIEFDKATADTYTVVISKLDEDEFTYVQNGVEYRFKR